MICSKSETRKYAAPRDNVIVELRLFMGHRDAGPGRETHGSEPEHGRTTSSFPAVLSCSAARSVTNTVSGISIVDASISLTGA